MNNFTRRVIGAIALTTAALAVAPAEATPFAGVQNAYWDAEFSYYTDANFTSSAILPDGINISCFGASSFGNYGCGGSASLIVNDGSASISQTGGFTVTNTNDFDLPGFLVFTSNFSAFNPGGNPIGAQVDDPSYQFASFSSSIIGPAPGIGDFHGCNTKFSPNMGPNACGVFSPDSSQGTFGVPLLAGQTVTSNYQINIAATVYAPEPVTLSLFGVGLAGAAVGYRRRKLGLEKRSA